MEKRYVYITILILAIGIVIAYTSSIPDPGHGGNNVLVSVNGFNMTLQEAIDGGFLVDQGSVPSTSGITSISTGHSSENVWVSVDGDERTLQNAINTIGLCGSGSSSYSSSISLGHSADDILVSINGDEKTLQAAINSGEFCCVPDCSCAATTCVGSTCTDPVCGTTCAGTKADSTWTPATSTVCDGVSFTQTGDCGNTQTAIGTLPDIDGGWSPWSDWESTIGWRPYGDGVGGFCSEPCGIGEQWRYQTCGWPSQKCGGDPCPDCSYTPCPQCPVSGCPYRRNEIRDCNTDPCDDEPDSGTWVLIRTTCSGWGYDGCNPSEDPCSPLGAECAQQGPGPSNACYPIGQPTMVYIYECQ